MTEEHRDDDSVGRKNSEPAISRQCGAWLVSTISFDSVRHYAANQTRIFGWGTLFMRTI